MRGKANAQQAGGPADLAAQGGFLALLASLESTLPGDVLPSDLVVEDSVAQSSLLSAGNAVDSNAVDSSAVHPSLVPADPASLAAWQGMLAPGGAAGTAVAAAGSGSTPSLAGMAGTEWLPAADGLVAQTAMLDGAAQEGGASHPPVQ
jgi:flagellar hook-length control protein FliK